MNTCTWGFKASLVASYTASISDFLHLANPHTAVVVKVLAIASTDLKLPVLEAGKPASSTSTPHFSSCLAIFNLSSKLKLTPGVCSPSLSVVSKIWICSSIKNTPLLLLFFNTLIDRIL